MDPARPPSYVLPSPSNPFHRIAQSQRDAFEPLPTYSYPHRRRRLSTANRSNHSRTPRAEHVIPLTTNDASHRSWAQMKIQSSAKSASHIPSFRPGDEIVGFVELDLPREKSITSITITVSSPTFFCLF
jgi:hypothetical protein